MRRISIPTLPTNKASTLVYCNTCSPETDSIVNLSSTRSFNHGRKEAKRKRSQEMGHTSAAVMPELEQKKVFQEMVDSSPFYKLEKRIGFAPLFLPLQPRDTNIYRPFLSYDYYDIETIHSRDLLVGTESAKMVLTFNTLISRTSLCIITLLHLRLQTAFLLRSSMQYIKRF